MKGVTVVEFVELMKTHARERYGGRVVSYPEAQRYLEECVASGLLTKQTDWYGRTSYVPTPELVQTLGALQ